MKQRAAAHATALSQHGASVLALSAISAVIAGEALSDWLMIRKLPSTTSHLAGLELSLRTIARAFRTLAFRADLRASSCVVAASRSSH